MSFYGKVYNYITGAFNKIKFKNFDSNTAIENSANQNAELSISAGNEWIEFEGNGDPSEINLFHKELNIKDNLPDSVTSLCFWNSDGTWDIRGATLDAAGHLKLSNTENIMPMAFLTYTDNENGVIIINKITPSDYTVIYEGELEEATNRT